MLESSPIIDQVDDKNRQEFARLSKLYGLPEFAKQASVDKTFDPDEQPSTIFADPVQRRFPCHTKASTYVSAMFLVEKQAEMPAAAAHRAQKRMERFVDYWGIRPEYESLQEKYAELHADPLSRLPDSAFALVDTVGGEKVRQYPLRNPEEIKQAASWLLQYRDMLAFRDRQKIAGRIIEKADEFNIQLDEEVDDALQKTAGRGVGDPVKIADMIRRRPLAHDRVPNDVRETMEKFASSIESNPGIVQDPATLASVCETVDGFDHAYNLVGKYTDRFQRPEEVVFAGTLKMAEHWVKQACVLQTGTVYDRDQFKCLKLADVRSVLGTDIVQEVADGILIDPEKMADVAATLPRRDAELLDRLMLDAGQAPMKKSASYGPSEEERAALAESYAFAQNLPGSNRPSDPTGVTGSRIVGG